MLEYYSNRLCIPARELIERGVMSASNYRQMVARKRLDAVRTARGKGCYALVSVESLPDVYKEKVREIYPQGARVRLLGWLRSNYETDQTAAAFFMDMENTGIALPGEKIKEYVTNASVLNTCIRLYNNTKAIQRTMGERYSWEQMAAAIEGLREEFGHTLPASVLRFRKKVAEYRKNGYGCLISGKYGNQSARKVNFKIERLIVSIACQKNKPYNTSVWEMYNMFVCGEYDVYSYKTGEIYDPNDFCDKNGAPIALSETTVNNYLNKPNNVLLIKRALLSETAFLHEEMPHMHRHGGEFSLSQITLDDVDLSRKLKDTKQRVHAYYAYDVVSQCLLGASYSRKKDDLLVLDCFRDMFRLIERNGWGMPAGIEVENHLMTKYKEGFLQAGVVFPFVHFCAPQNSQEKYAEPLNGAKKRSVIHKNHPGIGRFYGKGKWRVESDKISDENNDTYEEKEYFSYEQLIAEDIADNKEWNNSLHTNQKKYPGMTRRQVLVERMNPWLKPYDKMSLSRFIGECVPTSIRRNSTVRVCYDDWWLSDPSVLERLQPNNYNVEACFLPDEEGKPTDVYLFQNGRFIDKVEKVETYNRVMSEQTQDDDIKYIEQQKKVAKFKKYIRDNELDDVGISSQAEDLRGSDAVELPSAACIPAKSEKSEKKDYCQNALEQI